ncbi:MAG TPA: MIP family channel protein [Gemmataceae bacterium]|nr:MIP family channel protein [Gemmataceae bacterium]
MGADNPPLLTRCLAEVLGTFVLIFFGCGAVHVAIVIGALTGLWQVAIVWGVAIMVAVYVFGGVSGAHINPAVTTALAVWGRFPRGEVLPYVVSQVVGAFLAAAVLFAFYHPFLAEKEKAKNVVRGEPGSEITAMCYGEYYPNPGRIAGAEGEYRREEHERLNALVGMPVAFAAEMLGTLVLALVVFALTDERNRAAPLARLAPVFIGLTVAILIAVIAPLTQACFNPARDFGPRLFAYLAGWGPIALPGPNGAGFFTVYIVAPVVGAVLGGGLYVGVVRPALPDSLPAGRVEV